jgi:hypothetical protein
MEVKMNDKQKKKYPFFVDGKQFGSDDSSITGAGIKQIAGIPAEYQLFREEQGETPDKPIADSEGVDLTGKEKHFFAVPPATFGRQ